MFDSPRELGSERSFSLDDYNFVRDSDDNIEIWRHKVTRKEVMFFHFSDMDSDEFREKVERMFSLWHPSILNVSGVEYEQQVLKIDIPANGPLDKIESMTHEQTAKIVLGVCSGIDFLDFENVPIKEVTASKIFLNKEFEAKLLILNDVMHEPTDALPFESFVRVFSDIYEAMMEKCDENGHKVGCSAEFLKSCRNGDFETSDELFMWLHDSVHNCVKDEGVEGYETVLSKLRKFNARACFLCGKLLFHGQGFQRDFDQAELCLKAAIVKGSERASKQLKRMRLRMETEIAFEVQERLVGLSVESFPDTVSCFLDLIANSQSCVARNIVGFARRSWAKVNLLVQLIVRVGFASCDFRDDLLLQIFENIDCFSIDLLYRLYQKQCFDIQDIIEKVSDVDIEDATMFLPLFGELMKEHDYDLYSELIMARDEEEEESVEVDPEILKLVEAIRAFTWTPKLAQASPDTKICPDKRDPLTLLKKDLTLFEYAALWGNVRCFKSMLERTENVSRMVVACAVTGGSIPILQLLRERKCSFKGTAHVSVKYFRHDVLEWLIDNRLDEYSPVLEFLAAEQNNVIFFLNYSFDPERKDTSGNTILHIAAQYGSIDVAKILSCSIDWRIPNKDGYSAYDYADESWPELADFFNSLDGEEECNGDADSPLASYGSFSNRFKPTYDDDDSSSSDSDSEDDFEAIRQKRLSARKSLAIYISKIIPEPIYKSFKVGQCPALKEPPQEDKPEWVNHEYDALIRDVLAEIAHEPQYLVDTYPRYIERFVNMLYSGKDNFVETFPKNLHQELLADERDAQVAALIEISDVLLESQLRACLQLDA